MLPIEERLKQLIPDLGEGKGLVLESLYGRAEIGFSKLVTPVFMRELLKAHTLVEDLADFRPELVLETAIEEARNRASIPALIEAKQSKNRILDSRLDRVTGAMQRIVLEYIPTSKYYGYYLLKLVKNGVDLISFASIPDKPSIKDGKLQCNTKGYIEAAIAFILYMYKSHYKGLTYKVPCISLSYQAEVLLRDYSEYFDQQVRRSMCEH